MDESALFKKKKKKVVTLREELPFTGGFKVTSGARFLERLVTLLSFPGPPQPDFSTLVDALRPHLFQGPRHLPRSLSQILNWTFCMEKSNIS